MSHSYLKHAEWAMSPAEFDKAWPPPRKEMIRMKTSMVEHWYVSPVGSQYGYISAASWNAAEHQRMQILGSALEKK